MTLNRFSESKVVRDWKPAILRLESLFFWQNHSIGFVCASLF